MPNRTDISPIERIAGYHWEALNREPVKVARPLILPASLRKIRGDYKRGNYMERTGLLGTFVGDGRGVERVTFNLHSPGADFPDGCTFVLIVKNRWESWAGYLSPAQWEALRAALPASVEFANL